MKLIKKYTAGRNVIVICVQELEEPGEDTSRYDKLCPTVVKPKPRVPNVSAGHIEIFISHSATFNLLVPRDVNYTVLFVTHYYVAKF
jgi:hypothetical protein